MKLQGNLKALNKLRSTYNKDYDQIIENLQKGYYVDLVKYQEDLLLKIANDNNENIHDILHKLDYNEMHEKYIKNFKKSLKKTSKKIQLIEEGSDSETAEIQNNLTELEENINVLEKTKIDGKVCFIENKEGGTIYDKDVIKIGEVKEGEFILYNE